MALWVCELIVTMITIWTIYHNEEEVTIDLITPGWIVGGKLGVRSRKLSWEITAFPQRYLWYIIHAERHHAPLGAKRTGKFLANAFPYLQEMTLPRCCKLHPKLLRMFWSQDFRRIAAEVSHTRSSPEKEKIKYKCTEVRFIPLYLRGKTK